MLQSSVPLRVPTRSDQIQFDQSRLNILDRSRKSRLPWRGQFSPELVEYLLETVCPDAHVVLDPFCGSGTVLFEASQRGGLGLGAEVNPAAWHLACLACLSSLSPLERRSLKSQLAELRANLKKSDDLLSASSTNLDILRLVEARETPLSLRQSITSAILLGMGDKPSLSDDLMAKGLLCVESLLGEIETHPGSAECYLADARALPIDNANVDAVITSPPYINVFNYHQNYRPAAELLGWHPLEAARSEIGANRKHRQNRFLTVIQYCLDMAQVFDELTRVCKKGALIVFVVGRESNVLGAAFRNGDMLEQIMDINPGIALRQRTERSFMNRYGQEIFEDIIIGQCIEQGITDLDPVRSIAAASMTDALPLVPEKNRAMLESALFSSARVLPSPLLAISKPDFIN
ncbi:DNA methyltransferase [Burkholderia vietnamiensis]|nr:DNA methyltransferase [Burkholderia vietnamiensis]MCA8180974.1 site-specific DNA-methyltransferase [Burkholderia vietnamiensis]UEC03150.1 site-specific DNA-methyltransferase [Burkholderia vietnamiensis]